MNKTLRKLLILLPVLVISMFYFRVLYHEVYSNTSFKRIAGFVISIFLLYGWFILVMIRRKHDDLLQSLVQAGFFVYIFAVLQLTGYFILFKELSSTGWWDKMNHRIETHDHVNFVAFKTIGIYKILDKQVAGNFVMLLPLGILLPLMYKKLRKFSGFFAITIICLLVSASIELLQLATSYRSTDIDDVILNTSGASAGFIIFQLMRLIISPWRKTSMTNN